MIYVCHDMLMTLQLLSSRNLELPTTCLKMFKSSRNFAKNIELDELKQTQWQLSCHFESVPGTDQSVFCRNWLYFNPLYEHETYVSHVNTNYKLAQLQSLSCVTV